MKIPFVIRAFLILFVIVSGSPRRLQAQSDPPRRSPDFYNLTLVQQGTQPGPESSRRLAGLIPTGVQKVARNDAVPTAILGDWSWSTRTQIGFPPQGYTQVYYAQFLFNPNGTYEMWLGGQRLAFGTCSNGLPNHDVYQEHDHGPVGVQGSQLTLPVQSGSTFSRRNNCIPSLNVTRSTAGSLWTWHYTVTGSLKKPVLILDNQQYSKDKKLALYGHIVLTKVGS